ncbi:MAG TPA: 23S rRNA (adenine(2030)-N(6))-methyltransferase RlmJ [Opitutaceae bacterium]|nr:23S rRNA (adenine(2030)-N(6))-methyltransferase RlmJ [Opitutaceae bacterium]
MNYRHHFHAGNFADVMKHALLTRLIRALEKKEKGFLYLDTHAGRGGYDLRVAETGDSLARKPEWPDGIGRLWTLSHLPPEIGEYLDVVRAFDHQRGNVEPTLRFYPGSPWLARLLLRPQDRLVLCEKHPAECAALCAEFAADRQVVVREMDGYEAVRALLPPPERRALVLIDPPYEAQDEFAQVAAALGEGLRRLAGGVFVVWYPLTERARVDEFFDAVRALNPPPTLAVELTVAGRGASMKMPGCGLVIVNPPWKFSEEAESALRFLAPVLTQPPGGGGSHVRWLVAEK